MQRLTFGWQFLRRLMKQVGPYMLIELLLPGGTLFALILHISRCGAWSALQPMPVVCQPYSQCQVLVECNTVCDRHAFAPFGAALPVRNQNCSDPLRLAPPLG
jgi:hypothetical protein